MNAVDISLRNRKSTKNEFKIGRTRGTMYYWLAERREFKESDDSHYSFQGELMF